MCLGSQSVSLSGVDYVKGNKGHYVTVAIAHLPWPLIVFTQQNTKRTVTIIAILQELHNFTHVYAVEDS